jgi:hypothetical protein
LDEAQRKRFAAETRTDEEVRTMVITWEDAIAESEARGEALGRLRAMRDDILRVLHRRLKSVPTSVREKLDAVEDSERLEEIFDQALTVNSVDELHLEDESST